MESVRATPLVHTSASSRTEVVALALAVIAVALWISELRRARGPAGL
eukprot:CAMPEP_0194494250 /NCGR_PEP_ID=MMETSP0253-20130528/12219_1 /TAXON_ID=2966 /ORGANISM="Noctiluca scintillans" /LENGTH=46 /DNA_ID= /DNA_START= /DNA_END= /DNA_ORIENTATION=